MRAVTFRLAVSALALALAVPASSQAASDGPSTVRVRILSSEAPSEVSVHSVGSPLRVEVDGEAVGQVTGSARLRQSGAEVELVGGGLTARGRHIRLLPGPVRVQSGRTDRVYAGRLDVSAGRGLQLVNHVPLTDYVASVVAGEYPFAESEGVKAQAVLARTYALRRLDPSAPYDLEDDQRAQVYKGQGVVTPRSLEAARATSGEVLTYRGELAEALYYSSSGGHTADNETVWDTAPVPYLRGVPDPYDASSPDHTWQTSARRDDLHRALSNAFGGRVTNVTVDRRSAEGRVLRLRVDGGRREIISGTEFREAVNAALGFRTIRSTRFEVSSDGDRYVFDGRGFGHGVGMSQYGARGLAQAGRSYREILAYYFQGADVSVTTTDGHAALVASTRPPFQAREDDPVVRGATEARRWPTPRRIIRSVSRPPAEAEAPASEPPSAPRRRAW